MMMITIKRTTAWTKTSHSEAPFRRCDELRPTLLQTLCPTYLMPSNAPTEHKAS